MVYNYNMIIHGASDLHRQHLALSHFLTKGDLLVLTGDFDCIDEASTFTFLNWVIKISKNYKYGVVFTPGNHDSYIEESYDEVKEYLNGHQVQILINESTSINGLLIYGSPHIEGRILDRIYGAYSKDFKELEMIYKSIPQNVDLLLTHTPPKGILDNWLGSEALARRIKEVKPKVNLFGHIHKEYGYHLNDGVHYFNCAIVGSGAIGPFNPVVLEYNELTKELTHFHCSTMDIT